MYYLPNFQQRNGYQSQVGYDYRQYKPVTAYTIDRPIYVNYQDINKLPYQALNYQPVGAEYPYVYVPIAQFSKVGAVVNWDDGAQTLTVTTDYYQLRNQLAACQQSLKECMTAVKTQMAEHPPSSPMNKLTQEQLTNLISPYIIRPEKGWGVWMETDETENKFGSIFIEHIQPGPITQPPGATLSFSQELLDKLTNAFGYPVRVENATRHWTRLGVFKY
jgi:hypothetical protein